MMNVKLLTTCAVLIFASNAHAATIAAPPANTILAPGGMVTVRVAPSFGEQLATVAVMIGGGSPIAAAQSTTAPGAFEAQVSVPAAMVGPTLVMSYTKRSDGTASMDFIEVTVEPGAVTRLMMASPPVMNTVGAIYQLDVKALFADGVIREVTLPEKGTTYVSSNDAVLGVDADGEIQARSSGTAIVTVSNRGQSLAQTIQVAVPNPPTNHIPTANSGANQTVAPQTLVTLSAAGSSDPDGDPLTYKWRQVGGRLVILRTPTAQQTVFTAPRVDGVEVLTFSLVVSDNHGATTFPTSVQVTVDPSLVPVAPPQ